MSQGSVVLVCLMLPQGWVCGPLLFPPPTPPPFVPPIANGEVGSLRGLWGVYSMHTA